MLLIHDFSPQSDSVTTITHQNEILILCDEAILSKISPGRVTRIILLTHYINIHNDYLFHPSTSNREIAPIK